MIEEAALGNTSRLDQFLDRRRGQALLNDRVIGTVEQPPVRLRPFAGRQLYRRQSLPGRGGAHSSHPGDVTDALYYSTPGPATLQHSLNPCHVDPQAVRPQNSWTK